MNELLIEKRNFENQKNKLKKFSKNIPNSVNLPNSKTESGLFGWFDHKVTGDQLNNLTNKIQTYLKATNSNVIKIIREFDGVYNTFDTLDKEYLNKIIASVKAAEIVSKQANNASKKAQNNSDDIRKLIDVQKITINKLIEFKNKFESVHQVGDKWNYIKNLKEQTDSIQENFIQNTEKIEEQVKILHQNLENQKNDILAKLDISSSETFDKINELKQSQDERHRILRNKIKFLEESSNEKLTIQELRITEQKEEILEILDKLSTKFFTRINNLDQHQKNQYQSLNKEVALINNDINLQREQFSKKIKYIIIILCVLGGISLTHVILNILKIV
jgi:hypothetical protein